MNDLAPTPVKEIAVKTTDLFDTYTCGRCGGCGRYSWNAMHGDRCYGCNGTGFKLSKPGAAARAAWIAAYTKTKRVGDVVAGEKVVVMNGSKRIVKTVERSEADALNAGRWTIKFVVTAPNQLGGYGFASADAEIDLPVTAEEKRAAYEQISAMPGALGWPTEVLA